MLPFSLIELWGTVLSITVPTIHFEAQNWMSLQKDWLIVFASVEIDTNYWGGGRAGMLQFQRGNSRCLPSYHRIKRTAIHNVLLSKFIC